MVRTPSSLRVHVLPNPELRRTFDGLKSGQDINVTGIWLSRGPGAARSAAAASAGSGHSAHAARLPPALQRLQMASAWAAAGSGGNTSLAQAASVAPNALSVYCFMPSVMQISGGKQTAPRVSGETCSCCTCSWASRRRRGLTIVLCTMTLAMPPCAELHCSQLAADRTTACTTAAL